MSDIERLVVPITIYPPGMACPAWLAPVEKRTLWIARAWHDRHGSFYAETGVDARDAMLNVLKEWFPDLRSTDILSVSVQQAPVREELQRMSTPGHFVFIPAPVDPELIERVRRQFNASIAKVTESWRMPVFASPDPEPAIKVADRRTKR